MVFPNQYAQSLVNKFMSFKKSNSFNEEVELMSSGVDSAINSHTVLNALTDYVICELATNCQEITQEELDIYEYTELLRQKFYNFPEDTNEGEIDNAICTCFLENLLNRASSNKIKYERFIPYLGEKSKEYCKSWDQFTGVRSPGLWGDLEWHRAPKGPQSMIEENNKLDK